MQAINPINTHTKSLFKTELAITRLAIELVLKNRNHLLGTEKILNNIF